MRKLNLVASTAVGIVIGAVLINSVPAAAQWAVIDVASITQEIQSVAKESGILDVLNAMNTVQNTISNTMSSINKAIGGTTYGDTNTLLQEGFTQTANYLKGQVGAIEGITDASNTAMSQFRLGIRDAQIRDEQTPSPASCVALDGGVGTQSAAVSAFGLYQTLAATHDLRDEAGQNMPSYYGTGQGVASNGANHLALYCDATDQSAGLCSNGLGAKPDADQRFSSLFGAGTYPDQASIAAAKDYAINLIEPVAPGALRGDQLASVAGQDAAVRRRSYNARMSLAQSVVDQEIAMQTASVPLTAVQQQYLSNMGLPAQQNGSLLQVMQIESERRLSDVSWASWMANAPPAAVEREIATELAQTNYLLFQTYKLALQHTTISATQLAASAEHDFMPTVRMPAPSLATSTN
jgi:hypothetical protein